MHSLSESSGYARHRLHDLHALPSPSESAPQTCFPQDRRIQPQDDLSGAAIVRQAALNTSAESIPLTRALSVAHEVCRRPRLDTKLLSQVLQVEVVWFDSQTLAGVLPGFAFVLQVKA